MEIKRIYLILILMTTLLFSSCVDYKEYEDWNNDSVTFDVLDNIDCNDVLYNAGQGVSYGNSSLIQQLCLQREIERMDSMFLDSKPR